jgi:hypothetical protein
MGIAAFHPSYDGSQFRRPPTSTQKRGAKAPRFTVWRVTRRRCQLAGCAGTLVFHDDLVERAEIGLCGSHRRIRIGPLRRHRAAFMGEPHRHFGLRVGAFYRFSHPTVWSGLSSRPCKKTETNVGQWTVNCATCPNHSTRIARLSFRGNGTVCRITK